MRSIIAVLFAVIAMLAITSQAQAAPPGPYPPYSVGAGYNCGAAWNVYNPNQNLTTCEAISAAVVKSQPNYGFVTNVYRDGGTFALRPYDSAHGNLCSTTISGMDGEARVQLTGYGYTCGESLYWIDSNVTYISPKQAWVSISHFDNNINRTWVRYLFVVTDTGTSVRPANTPSRTDCCTF